MSQPLNHAQHNFDLFDKIDRVAKKKSESTDRLNTWQNIKISLGKYLMPFSTDPIGEVIFERENMTLLVYFVEVE